MPDRLPPDSPAALALTTATVTVLAALAVPAAVSAGLTSPLASWAIGGGGLLVAAVPGWLTFAAVRRRLRGLAEQAQAASTRATAAEERVAAVAKALRAVGERADRVADAARRATQAVEQVSGGAQAQNDDLDLMANAIGQSAQAIASVTDSTRTASDMVRAASGFTVRGKDEMARLLRVAETIAENSRRIGRITEAITQIAVKTNILSVNASIEAARAGEQGKGFEVVAEEVGKLADSAVESARQIREIVETAGTLAEESMSATATVVRMMDDIADRVAQVDRMFHSIAVAMEQQQSTMKDIQANVTNIRLVASGNAEASDRITSTMADLVRAAEDTRAGAAGSEAG